MYVCTKLGFWFEVLSTIFTSTTATSLGYRINKALWLLYVLFRGSTTSSFVGSANPAERERKRVFPDIPVRTREFGLAN